MLLLAQRDLALDLTRTPFIGDDERDQQAAEAAGSPFMLATDDRPLLALTRSILAEAAD
jgi:histidinol phosphatase-like enzyme